MNILTSPMSGPRFLIAAAMLIAAASVFVFSGSDSAPADKTDEVGKKAPPYAMVIQPQETIPGGVVRLNIVNGSTDKVLVFSAVHSIERLGGNGWDEANTEFYGSDPAFLAFAITTHPGTTGQAEPIAIPENIRPGLYRVTKHMRTVDFGEDLSVPQVRRDAGTVTAEFVVRESGTGFKPDDPPEPVWLNGPAITSSH